MNKELLCCGYGSSGKRTSTTFPKTFMKSGKILSKYKGNNLDISDNDILEVLIRLYVAEEKAKIVLMLSRCRINPNFQQQITRNDLEYFIPQLINFLVFHQQLKEDGLVQFIFKASKIDFFFAHLVYFQLKSLSEIVNPRNSVALTVVKEFLHRFEEEMIANYKGTLLIASQILQIHLESQTVMHSDLRSSLDFHKQKSQNRQSIYKGMLKQRLNSEPPEIRQYGTEEAKENFVLEHPGDINLVDYYSIFGQPIIAPNDQSFLSTLEFLDDLAKICDSLSTEKKKADKVVKLRSHLMEMNARLPAAVYIPFVQNRLRHYVVLNIVVSESRVFSTKMRSPYSLCLELYRPDEEENLHLDKQMSIPLVANMLLQNKPISIAYTVQGQDRRSCSYNTKDAQEKFNIDIQNIKFQRLNTQLDDLESEHQKIGVSRFYQYGVDDRESVPIDQQSNHRSFSESSDGRHSLESSIDSKVSYLQRDRGIHLTKQEVNEMRETIFGESSSAESQRIKSQSPYRNLKSWRLTHLIVKTGDNLKQEQFALQLIHQFAQIFQSEGLPLKLRYYEVLSLGPDSGIMEMVRNATTIDGLQRNLQQKYKQFTDFSDFFRSFFRDNMEQALNNYLHSLVAYSLVCYFLQIKDRHNGNILLDTEGHLIHIDFGFFLSIAPGKGLEFEKKVPFKLLSDYIKVLGGEKGVLFDQNFRRLFFQGFKAVQKHQKEIMLLVEMMYTGHGTTLPCLQKGEEALRALEARFNPRVASDAELFVHCQEGLINKALDNWRAKWYDKFQYFVQGVFY